ncbi:MAG: CxxC-x17-CxxC domain-containing protein [Candidatus Rokuibacteriota bacterium]
MPPPQGRPQAPREMTTATCSDCGKVTQVPFKPTAGRPVYCRECFTKHKPPMGGGGGFGGRGGGSGPGGRGRGPNGGRGERRVPKKQRWARTEYQGYDPSVHAPNEPRR